MEKLIEALTIFLKYGNPSWPTHCEHDTLWVCYDGDDKEKMSKEDLKKLNDLSFFFSEENDCFQSFKYGSA